MDGIKIEKNFEVRPIESETAPLSPRDGSMNTEGGHRGGNVIYSERRVFHMIIGGTDTSVPYRMDDYDDEDIDDEDTDFDYEHDHCIDICEGSKDTSD